MELRRGTLWKLVSFSVLLVQNVLVDVACKRDEHDHCPSRCSCYALSQTVNCTDAGYTKVPHDLPSGTVNLILDGNVLKPLTNESLERLVGVRLLSMRNCSITTVEGKGFSYLSESLRVLRMSNNPLAAKSCNFLKHLHHLKSLDLSGTGIGAYLRVLQHLTNLKQVALSQNLIRKFPRGTLGPNVESLNLSGNHIEKLPKFEGKVIELSQLKHLSLRGNEIRDLKNNSLLLFPKLKLLDLAGNPLGKVPLLAFRSDSIRILNLYNTKFRLDDGNWNIFHQIPNIERINMGFCPINCGNSTKAAFHDLRHLKELDLSGTKISSVSHMFLKLPNLAKLRLGSNRISTLRSSDFEEIADTLRELFVSSGRLSTITHESLPLKVWRNLRRVDFSDNRFLCDCNFVWLRRWLTRANASGVVVSGWDKYYCQTSKGQVNMFQLESPSDSDCSQDPLSEDPLFLIVLLLTALVWISAPMAATFHRTRWHLRYWYFMQTLKGKKRAERNREGEEPDNFTFDVFVGYSRSDFRWVIAELLPRLEEDCNLRLCIHERDWLPGRDIAENILDSIDQSRKTLLIVSNAFALSPWCNFELTMAQTRLMADDRDSLVLCLMEEIADCNLTPRLAIQMHRQRTYIEWTRQSNVGQQLFWANLKLALRKPSQSLMNESLTKEFLK